MKDTFFRNLFFATFFLASNIALAAQANTKPAAIAAYEAAWQITDSDSRLKQIHTFWSEESLYTDPSATAKGPAALNGMIDNFIRMFPGAKLESDPVLAMGDSYTWDWRIFTASDDLMVAGRDYAVLDKTGRISKLIGFWEPKGFEHSHKKVVATYFDSLFKTRDLKKISTLVNPDSVFHQSESLPYGGTFVGFDSWVKMYKHAASFYDLAIEQEPVLFSSADGNRITLNFVIKCTAKKSKKTLSMPISEHFELKEGKIVSIRPFYFDTKAFAAFLKE